MVIYIVFKNMHLIDQLGHYITQLIHTMPYFWTLLFMTLESTMIPIPSEAIMTPAGALAALGDINVILIVLAGTAGSLIGSIISYYIGKKGGELLSEKMLGKKGHRKAIQYFNTNGELTIFVGRLLPVVRHVISIPAGAFNMNFKKFVLWTTIGALLWCSILTFIGYKIGENWEVLEPYKMPLLIVGVAIFIVALIVKKALKKKRGIKG